MRRLFVKSWFFIGLFAVVVVGARYPAVGESVKPWINGLIVASMLLIGLRLDLREILTAFTDLRAVCLCLAFGFVLKPLLGWILAALFFRHSVDLYLGVMLAGAVPTTQVSSVVWTDFSRGNRALAVVLMAANV